ncbi:ThuA domain-containing protein [Actinoalloteichus hymeniacidonis]|uniref:ThuA-like domain-containing protein n=1 Tax=Actinoalloteichus hymeniacidonis TaxID=340345 RepID=A0AAC9HP84_9PSEU|nr:ThuA domain-containing protein [Actinoalloteichus hymeniacidonis]AOS63042.1 hypothetical protein TL08_11140 [Actinoalloteichus hymeniacidonis]MBB5908923.1 hypothetical protein [Actinoalloteichus hymeniacidonis]
MNQPVDHPRVLVFSRTTAFRHRSIPAGVQAIRELGSEHGFAVEATEDAAVLTAEAAHQTAIVFLSTSGTVLDAGSRAELEKAVRAGAGFVGIHAASTTERDWPFYRELLGARFVDHPAIQPAGMTVEDATHPATAHLGATWDVVDEWYNFDGNPRGEVRVLLSVDESGYDPGPNTMGEDHPISWCHERFGGRSWYTALGHDIETYSDPSFRAHLLGGIRWAARLTA